VTAYTPAVGTVERKITTAWHLDWRLEVQRAEPIMHQMPIGAATVSASIIPVSPFGNLIRAIGSIDFRSEKSNATSSSAFRR
jgi:hypothetical protein